MYKHINTLIQVFCLWTPLIYWNLNADTASTKEVIVAFAIGASIIVISQFLYMNYFKKYDSCFRGGMCYKGCNQVDCKKV